jgi:Spy/CpxP family protein refolding chaperone
VKPGIEETEAEQNVPEGEQNENYYNCLLQRVESKTYPLDNYALESHIHPSLSASRFLGHGHGLRVHDNFFEDQDETSRQRDQDHASWDPEASALSVSQREDRVQGGDAVSGP